MVLILWTVTALSIHSSTQKKSLPPQPRAEVEEVWS